jgi:CheY-like chemotaxis protein
LGKRLLIVDDDPDVLETLKETFEHEGYAVSTASNGTEALDRLRQLPAPPCAAVVDLVMPKMSGTELFDAMQSDGRWSTIPVILCSSMAITAPAGALFMRKPINLARLVDEVKLRCK